MASTCSFLCPAIELYEKEDTRPKYIHLNDVSSGIIFSGKGDVGKVSAGLSRQHARRQTKRGSGAGGESKFTRGGDAGDS